jgi:hypothetical protein
MRPELLLRLYPRAWRERYGEELLALIETQGPLGLGAWLDLLRGALVAYLHPLAADRDATRSSSMMIARPPIALSLTRWGPLVAVSIAWAIVLREFLGFSHGVDWRVWLPPSLLQELIRSPFSSFSPTPAEAQALELPRVLFFTPMADQLDALTVRLGMFMFAFAVALMWAVVARRLTSRSRPL